MSDEAMREQLTGERLAAWDRYAAAALAGSLAAYAHPSSLGVPTPDDTDLLNPERVAEWADAMLRERDRRTGDE